MKYGIVRRLRNPRYRFMETIMDTANTINKRQCGSANYMVVSRAVANRLNKEAYVNKRK